MPARVPTPSGSDDRFILVDSYARYASAFGADVLGTPIDAIPAALREAALTQRAARREILARYIALAGPVTVGDVRARYDFDERWVRRRLEEWERNGVLVRGVFGGDRSVDRWASRRLLEQARRRELAQARKQIEAVPIESFARFLQRWQHLTPDAQLNGHDAVASALGQLYGLARPAEGWERDYLPARVEEYDAGALTRLASSGALVWAAEPRPEQSSAGAATIGRIRFFERGTGRLWLSPPADDATLTSHARTVRDALGRQGASFTADVSSATGLTSRQVRDALRELVAAGVVTNDTVDALRDVLRWKPVLSVKERNAPDPTRWLPADFTPSANRPVVQRRVNLRRLPKWKRPDREEVMTWGGRWSLVHLPSTLGPDDDEQELAERIARQWLTRYGIVSRDWWRREKPPVGWRTIYQELKRLEFRGEVRRGYFVAGLAGAQFALPEAVEMLRTPTESTEQDPVIVFAASDPSNVFTLPLAPGDGNEVDPLARPRGAGAMLVTRGGTIILVAEGRGSRLRVRETATVADVRDAARALADRLLSRQRMTRRRDLVVETIDGERAAASRWAEALLDAGFRSMGTGLRYYVEV